MYPTLLIIHSWIRWFALIAIFTSIFSAYSGLTSARPFSAIDNLIRHWTATIVHIQLIAGMLLYFKSPVTQYFWHNESGYDLSVSFFATIHPLMMLVSTIIITVGSALAKRKDNDQEKFKTILFYYGSALIIILAAIPWPFSPFAHRSYFRLH